MLLVQVKHGVELCLQSRKQIPVVVAFEAKYYLRFYDVFLTS